MGSEAIDHSFAFDRDPAVSSLTRRFTECISARFLR
jgi:hypothetical protein